MQFNIKEDMRLPIWRVIAISLLVGLIMIPKHEEYLLIAMLIYTVVSMGFIFMIEKLADKFIKEDEEVKLSKEAMVAEMIKANNRCFGIEEDEEVK